MNCVCSIFENVFAGVRIPFDPMRLFVQMLGKGSIAEENSRICVWCESSMYDVEQTTNKYIYKIRSYRCMLAGGEQSQREVTQGSMLVSPCTV